ncbi:MAG: hypothetical protein IPL12_16510 [Bacteroidetes bacterium]|nr:hypothetical protein [Bacteroidota bacterium]
MNNKLYKNYVDDIAHYLKQEKKGNLSKGLGSVRLNESFSSTPTMLWQRQTKSKRILEVLAR